MEETQNQTKVQATFMSPEINEISKALSEFQSEIKQPALNKTVQVRVKNGGAYSFKYADLSACISATSPLLKKNGLAVTQLINDGRMITILVHTSGQWFKSEINLGIERFSTYQDLGSAITYLKRYSYCAILGVVADEDNDADTENGGKAYNPHPSTYSNTIATTPKSISDIIKTIDPNDTTMINALTEIDEAQNRDSLIHVWNKYGDSFQTEPLFMQCMSTKRKQLGI